MNSLKPSAIASTLVGLALASGTLVATAGSYSAGIDAETGAYRTTVYQTGYTHQGGQVVNDGYGFVKTASHSKQGDVVDVAAGAGSFTTLVTAVQAAGLVDTLKGPGPFTIFAPTDEAFAKIPEDQLKALLEDKEALTAVLTYHVVPGKVLAADVVELSSADTVQGQPVAIDASDGVMVNDAKVVETDIMASNGVIHVIDTVLMPKQ